MIKEQDLIILLNYRKIRIEGSMGSIKHCINDVKARMNKTGRSKDEEQLADLEELIDVYDSCNQDIKEIDDALKLIENKATVFEIYNNPAVKKVQEFIDQLNGKLQPIPKKYPTNNKGNKVVVFRPLNKK
ncbi:MAG: hypothetical protein PHS45_03040 [Bacilli bacterium]|nr:hypothetical protein [Bacilli bacterium]